jgi:subtilisin family serine protease
MGGKDVETLHSQRNRVLARAWRLSLAAFLILSGTVSLPLRAVAARDVAAAVNPQAGIEIDPELLQQLDADETTAYLIYFRERPDLSAASTMDWSERGRFVVNALQETAARTQAAVRAYLDASGASYQPFWIDNVIVVERSNRVTFDGLLAYPGIASLRTYPVAQAIEPLPADEPAAAGVETVEANLTHIGADQVWALGYEGQGLVVASIDTGVRYTHQALNAQYRGNLGGGTYDHNYNWLGAAGGNTVPTDDWGHGTHVMGIMLGDDGGANRIGMAPEAQWIACDGCESGYCPGTPLLTCAQWIAAPYPIGDPGSPDPDRRPQVVNNSWTICGGSYNDWFQGVVDSWHAEGIYPVFATGNANNCGYSSPPGCNTVGNPARYGNVTAVGATGQTNGQVASYSLWGPTDNPDTVNPRGYADLKPQVVAPGTSIRSSYAGGDDIYANMSGTSMAAPHVAGLVALMWSAAPCLAGDYATTETILETTATPIPYATGCGGEGPGNVPNMASGWGEINALAAVQAALGLCTPDFTLDVAPASLEICAPNNALFDVGLGAVNNFDDAVTLSLSGNPAGAAAAFAPNPLTPPGMSQLTVGNTGSAAAGTYALDVSGTSSSLVHQDAVTLTLRKNAPGGPSLTAPAQGSTGQPVAPAFAWSAVANAASYDLEVALDPAFSNVVVSATGLTGSSYTPGSALASDTVYYWRVRAVNACGISLSPIWAFRTEAAPVCDEVLLNGDFEAGQTGWTESGDLIGQWGTPHGGAWYAQMGGAKRASDAVYQTVSIPAGASGSLTYWYSIDSVKLECGQDQAGLSINGTPVQTYQLCSATDTPGTPPYVQAVAVDLAPYAGTSVEIRFWTTTSSQPNPSTFRVDDVALDVCVSYPPVVADYSDLAASYGIAWHTGDGSLMLGNSWGADDEFGPFSNDPSDDGVSLNPDYLWEPGAPVVVNVTTNGGTASRYLAVWFDWNDDGDFADPSEKSISQQVYSGLNNITFVIPTGAGYTSSRPVYARFRLYESEPPGAGAAWGGAEGGEVEDHLLVTPRPTAVELIRFEALADGPAVQIEWETATELNNLGFNLYRSDTPDGPLSQLNEALIPGQAPGPPGGAVYTWRDEAVLAGATYSYWLELVDTAGTPTLRGPATVTLARPTPSHVMYLPLIRQGSK